MKFVRTACSCASIFTRASENCLTGQYVVHHLKLPHMIILLRKKNDEASVLQIVSALTSLRLTKQMIFCI